MAAIVAALALATATGGLRRNHKAVAGVGGEPVIVLGLGAIVVLLLFGLLAAVVLTALLIWILPFIIVVAGIYLFATGKQQAGMVALVVGVLLLVLAAVL